MKPKPSTTKSAVAVNPAVREFLSRVGKTGASIKTSNRGSELAKARWAKYKTAKSRRAALAPALAASLKSRAKKTARKGKAARAVEK